ncbi:hypothetical protein LINPERHAP1_LOCUS24172 [Linum perenne]
MVMEICHRKTRVVADSNRAEIRNWLL